MHNAGGVKFIKRVEEQLADAHSFIKRKATTGPFGYGVKQIAAGVQLGHEARAAVNVCLPDEPHHVRALARRCLQI